ncbi:UxaA family hydrolase [uncultured Roseobacter sp.]|uniref:UxaA family hydrolase n=1 Tax=uncultured Roseobacter sp. TaxID=114847 RepID=UPI00261C1ADC|nr:UxaA family hydrolase [uncultured Roseobacter sp.]
MSEGEKPAVRLLHLHRNDNVAVLMQDAESGATTRHGARCISIPTALGMGHKIAVAPIAKGTDVLKYGAPIGFAARDIAIGEHVHLHNVTSRYTVIEDMEAGQR